LAKDYWYQPVVFLEYDMNGDFPTRSSRWQAAYGGGFTGTPWIMVDSGNQISHGWVDFYTVYKGMVDVSLPRPPQAAMLVSTWLRTARIHLPSKQVTWRG
jgi:hypothetical protein